MSISYYRVFVIAFTVLLGFACAPAQAWPVAEPHARLGPCAGCRAWGLY